MGGMMNQSGPFGGNDGRKGERCRSKGMPDCNGRAMPCQHAAGLRDMPADATSRNPADQQHVPPMRDRGVTSSS